MPLAIVILRKAKRTNSVWELCDAYLNKLSHGRGHWFNPSTAHQLEQ
jgi:hypothetical protein